jgi:glycerophosphoryl diester phosphodiesterase
MTSRIGHPVLSVLSFEVMDLEHRKEPATVIAKTSIMVKTISALFLCLLLSANVLFQTPRSFDIEGHRGCRGLMPENSLPAFLKAIDLGVNTLELDVVVSRDQQLVVSHDPYFSADFTLDPDGKPIPADKQTQYNLFKMDYAEIRRYDVGSLGNKRFPDQQKIKTYKPLLREVFKETQKYIRAHRLPPVRYNVETKSTPAGDNIYQPAPAIFAKLLYNEILADKMQKFVMIQSFDVRTLQEFKKFPVKMPLVLLVENKDGIQQNIERLGFQPDVYSPNFTLVDESTVAYCREKGIMIIPWTVNEVSDMKALKLLKVDGIITDFPNRAVLVFRK